MAVKRQMNWLGEMRVDVPHMRLVESSVAGDFQDLAGTLMAGSNGLVAWGLKVTGTLGQPATTISVTVAGAVLLHNTATDAGAIFAVPVGTPDEVLSTSNTKVTGSFTPGTTNYIGIDLVRATDPTTTDAVKFRSASTGQEFTQTVPLGRVLGYVIHITTTDFTLNPTFAPVAKVVVDATGAITSITDCRQMFWRLGTGGTSPNKLATYTWSNRNENTAADDFTGGDKDITSWLNFNRAIMSRMWELGGGEHWYAPASDRGVRLVYNTASVFAATGENWYLNGANLLWQGLQFWFTNSTAVYNAVADQVGASPGLTDIIDGEVIYVDLDRTNDGATLTPVKATWATLSQPTIPGSRQILAWRRDGRVYVGNVSLPVNTGGVHATNTSFGTVKLFTAYAPDPPNPIVPVLDASDYVVARGMTRDAAGALNFGLGANDTSVGISKNTVLTTIFGALQVNNNFSCSTSIVNGTAVSGAGNGTGHGVQGTAGAGAGAYGIKGIGGAGANSVGVWGESTTSFGGEFTGGANSHGVVGHGTGLGGGVYAIGGNTSGAIGARGDGGPAGQGVAGNGGAGTALARGGDGVVGAGADSGGAGGFGAGHGVVGTGGAGTSGPGGVGVKGTGNATGNTAGVSGTGGGTGPGVTGTGGGGAAGGNGVEGTGTGTGGGGGVFTGSGTGVGVAATGPGGAVNPTAAPLRLTATTNDPTNLAEGDIWISGTAPNRYLKAYISGAARNVAGPF